MLPLFDLLNHKSGQPIRWEASADRIVFRAVEDIKEGEEVFNNYGGGRSNEQLLFFYGFAESELMEVRDKVTGMVLSCDFDQQDPEAILLLKAKHKRLLSEHIPCGVVGPTLSTLRLGPFDLGPLAKHPTAKQGEGENPQQQSLLPSLLLRALGIVVAASEDEEPDGTGPDALSLLHPSLVASLMAAHDAPPPSEEPRLRAASINVYREGRRKILLAALREVEERLASFASDDEDEAAPDAQAEAQTTA